MNRPYQPQHEAQNEIRPPVAQVEPATPVEPAVQLTEVPPVNSQREPVSESAGKGEVKP